ncbi:MAG: hypothetical protein C0599_00125 [Salinivirgaceae bacterium]|nr:MAG: hypothetical protein C0599_00125 [Salinivirgaceae bacterium]
MKSLIYIILIFVFANVRAEGLPTTIKISAEKVMKGDTVWMKLQKNESIKSIKEPLNWYSSIDGYLAKGKKLTTCDLSIGKHKITVLANSEETMLIAENEITVEKYTPSPKMIELINWMTGYFSSKNQADTSSDKYHIDVRLRMNRIWSQRTDGFWIYVEQSYATDTAKPYRQRLYHMIEANGKIKDEIYGINDDSLYLYGWQNPAIFDNMTDSDIFLKENCGLDFHYVESENLFEAKTKGCGCKASIPGIAYITSVSKIHKNYLTSWDLGFNSESKIVMGPDSPYIFEKKSNFDCK